MRENDRYRPGDYYIICDVTGFKIRRSEAVRTWDGLLVRRDQADPRHPQEFVRARADLQAVPEPRPQPADYFLTENEVTPDSLERSPRRIFFDDDPLYYGDEPLTF
jgi:hypothetical protein